ncbi:MAG: DUF2235 domain-containing protein [Burkholderiaceae bacterium]
MVRLERDALGRIVSRRRRLRDAIDESRFGYLAERLVTVRHPLQQSDRHHDAHGRLQRVEDRIAGHAYVQTFARGRDGRLLRHRLPDGSVLRHGYDHQGRPARLDWISVDGRVRPIVSAVRGLRAGVGRIDAAGLRLGNGIARIVERGPDGRLQSLAWIDDPRRSQPASIASAAGSGLPAWRYRWSAAGRLVETDAPGEHDRYAYDAMGRIRVHRRDTGAGRIAVAYFVHGLAGDLLRRRTLSGRDLDIRARHDRGAREPWGLPPTHAGRRLHYGAGARIARVDDASGRPIARYRYNAFGERVEKLRYDKHGRVIGGTRFLYHRRRLLAELALDGSVRRIYIYWAGQLVACLDYPGRPQLAAAGRRDGPGSAAGPSLYYFHGDHLGTPWAVTDAAGRVVWRGRYGAYGRLLGAKGGFWQPLRFPGQYADEETGWHDNYQRSYDPLAGGYLEPDPLGPAGGANPYGYADGNPLQAADPFGLILFAFDGTGNDVDSRTNVALFAEHYADDDAYDRLAGLDGSSFYAAGVGTGGGLFDNAVTGGALALGLRDRIDTQLARLDDYVGGRFDYFANLSDTAIGPDAPLVYEIDIVGFSRGAAAARDFANQLLVRRDGGYYRGLTGGGCVALEIRFMGLFDTVLSTHVGEFELDIPEAVDHVASAVAANEYRRLFPLESIHPDTEPMAGNRIERAFIGAHADIGGGYACAAAACDGGDLSDVALEWMLAQARTQGVPVRATDASISVVSHPILHDETTSWLYFDADPERDREVRFHAVSHTSPEALETPPPAEPIQAPLTSREAILEGMTSALSANFVTPDPSAQPGRVGTVDMTAYREWLAGHPDYREFAPSGADTGSQGAPANAAGLMNP